MKKEEIKKELYKRKIDAIRTGEDSDYLYYTAFYNMKILRYNLKYLDTNQ